MDIPSGWVQVLRGPRPKSEKWPVASSGRKQPTFNQQEPTRRQPAPRSNVRAPDPDAALVHARSKVSSLEAALTAMGSHQGPEVDALRSALQKAKQAAQERPLKVQLAQTDAFVERSRLRIKKLEEEREAEVELLNAAVQRQARLREQVAAEAAMTVTSPVTTNPSEEIARLKAKVAQLEAGSRSGEDEGRRFRPPRDGCVASDAFRSPGSREVVVGSTCGFAGRVGVCRLWFSGQADSIVGARCCEVARNVRGWRRRHVVALSTRGRSFCALLKGNWFRVVLLYGLRGVRVGEASNPGPSRQLADSPLPTRRSASLRALGSTAGHRRGLVVEVALGVVDVSAVALPGSPHVITLAVEPDVPVFDPMDSVDEDEFDALSRNATVGHADPQCPTQVDSDDEPMVSVGRGAVAASRRERFGSSDECPLSCQATQHDLGVSRQATPVPALGALATNQFFSLATDSDDEQPPTDLRCSDTDSIPEHVNRRRRLRLRWDPDPDATNQTQQGTPHVRRDVHRAAQIVRSLADRVGHVDDSQDIPRAIRRQQWSAFNVPLMWSASVGDNTCPVLQWLVGAAQHIESMTVGSTTVSGHDAAVVGWEALSEVMRSWNIRSREDLAEWIFRQGFPRPRWGAHINARAQERILTMAVAVDVRVSGLEAIYVQVALSWVDHKQRHSQRRSLKNVGQ